MLEPLSALRYQRRVSDILEAESPKAFRALTANRATDTDVLEQALLRATYRLDADAHPGVHAAAGQAATALGMRVRVELYADAEGSGTNAELIFVPSRAVVLFSGEMLNILSDDELCAVIGHELAHHLLWTADGGRYLATSRLLDAAESDARTPSAYLETARRLRLATELFADRGSLRACGQLAPAISSLVKATTGLRTVDATSYLKQASEVDLRKASEGSTHPETVLRAWALQRWVDDPDAADQAVDMVLAPQLDLSTVDIVGQDELAQVTRALVGAVLSTAGLCGSDELELAEHYGVSAASAPLNGTASAFAKETKRYLAAVLVDFATADPDSGVETQAQVLALAQHVGLGPETERMLGDELGLSDRARADLDRRVKQLSAAQKPQSTASGADA